MVCILIFSMTACGGGDKSTSTSTEDAAVATPVAADTTTTTTASDTEWAIYLYICGSNLESEGGAATNDLAELFAVTLPENVKVVIETGGSSAWMNDYANPAMLDRFVYDSNGLQLVEEVPSASMGSADTLSGFLDFAKTNYPAKKTGFVFWNHGGGSVNGAAFDELYDNDSLTLDEMKSAFSSNFELSADNQPFELIGFDTCLMATVDVAATYSDIGKYLVASQELEPGNGWNYTGLADALSANPTIDGADLGKAICDAYMEGCELVGTADNATLSLTNLSKVSELLTAYDDFGKEALANACIDPSFFSSFGRIASTTESYGGNTKEQGYTNMVDLGHLARQSADVLVDTSSNVLTALADCVEYKVNGAYRQEATGLSCYYSYNGDLDDFGKYEQLGTGEAFKYFYSYELTGALSDEGMNYISQMNYDSLPEIESLQTQGWENHPLEVDSEGAATLTLGEKALDVLSGMYIQLYYVDPEQDIMLLLGSDNDLIADWDAGVFKDNFRGKWGSINGNLVNMDLTFEGDGYNLYSVPIKLNDEDYNLSVVYDFTTAKYEIQGARKPIDENGMADKNLRYLVDGDVIKTIHYGMAISGDTQDLTPVEVATIVVDDTLSFDEIDLGDGIFLQMFEMRDAQGYSAYSDVIEFNIADGEITTSVGFTE